MVLKNYWMELSNKCKSNTQERFNYIMTEINKLKKDTIEPDSTEETDDTSSDSSSIIESKNRELVLKNDGKQTTNYTEGDKGHFKFIVKDNLGDVVEGASIFINGIVQDTVSDKDGKIIISDYDFNAIGEVSIVFTSKCEGYFDSDEVTLICNIVETD